MIWIAELMTENSLALESFENMGMERTLDFRDFRRLMIQDIRDKLSQLDACIHPAFEERGF